MTLIEKLRILQHLPIGSEWPEFLGGGYWRPSLSALCGEAADEIERLQASLVRQSDPHVAN